MLLQRITKPLAWAQLVISVVIISTVIYGHLKFHDTWAANSPFLESTRASLTNAKQSLGQANNSLSIISTELPAYVAALQGANNMLLKAPPVMEGIAEGMRFSIPSSIEMQGMKPYFVMKRPLEQSANELKDQAADIRQFANGLHSAQKTIQTMPSLLAEVSETMVSSQAAITQLEPMIGQIEILVNWGSLITLLIAIWCLMNSLTTLALMHNRSTTNNRNGVTQ